MPGVSQSRLERIVSAFVEWAQVEYKIILYDYQVEIARAFFSSLLIDKKDVFVKLARQAGKTEVVTLVIRLLMIFYRHWVGEHIAFGIASPKGEQAKTDVDRIKKSIPALRNRWGVEDREFSQLTVRAYIDDKLHLELFKFSLSPTTSNESKTIHVLIMEEAHKCDDKKRSDELDPMLAETEGVTWYVGVGCTNLCDFKRGCDGEMPNSVALKFDVDRVFADRRKVYQLTKDERHLRYERRVAKEIKKKGKENPEIKRNYYLIDTVEKGNFVSRERLLSCGRASDVIVPVDDLFFGIDWGRESDFTWAGVSNGFNDLIDMVKVPHMLFERQCEFIGDWLKAKRTFKVKRRNPDGSDRVVDENFSYLERVLRVRGDSTGIGDMPMEFLQSHSGLPMNSLSHVVFTDQSKHDMYTNFQEALLREVGDPMRFSYPSDHELAGEFEDQMCELIREYRGQRKLMAVHHPDRADAKDDAPDMATLTLWAVANGRIGELLIG